MLFMIMAMTVFLMLFVVMMRVVVIFNIILNLLVVFHGFIAKEAIQFHFLKVDFILKELRYCCITEIFGDMRVSLVIAPVMVVTVISVSVVMVMTIVVVGTVITCMSSAGSKLIFVLMVVVSLLNMMWCMVLRDVMTPAFMVVWICSIVLINFMMVWCLIHLMVFYGMLIDVMVEMRDHAMRIFVMAIIMTIIFMMIIIRVIVVFLVV